MNIAIFYGQAIEGAGKDEQDTLVQVETISGALSALGISSTPVTLSLNLQDAIHTLQQVRPDVVFNLVETVNGQGRLIHLGPAVLDLLQLRYTGAKTEAIFLTSNKLLAKQYLRHSGIATPEWFSLSDLTDNTPIRPGRYIMKSVWEHASVGLSETAVVDARSASELRQALQQHLRHIGGEGFVDVYIEGREFNLSVLTNGNGPEVLPPAEIIFDNYPAEKLKIVDYRAKWDDGSFEFHHTPRTFDFAAEDEPLLQQLRTIAIQCWELFDLRGYARVDFRVDPHGSPWVLEINTNPCLSPDAGFFAAAQRAGLRFEQVVQRILNDAA